MSIKSIEWQCVYAFDTMDECTSYILGGHIVDSKEQEVKFKWHPTRPGDGKRCSVFVCKTHAECPFMVRCQKVDVGVFELQVAVGIEHTGEAATLRAGCDISMHHLEEIQKMVETGAKPGRIFSTLTKREETRCRRLRIIPAVRPEGGLEGAMDANCRFCSYTTNTEMNTPHFFPNTDVLIPNTSHKNPNTASNTSPILFIFTPNT